MRRLVTPVLNAGVTLLETHAVCCGIVQPLAAGGLLGQGAGEIVESLPAELGLLAMTTPVVTFAVMKGQEAWHKRRGKKHCANHADCRPGFTRRQFWQNAALGYLLGAAVTCIGHLSHDHDHDAPPLTPVKAAAQFQPT